MDLFQEELESFQVNLPGGKIVSFCNDEAMGEQMLLHYGDWKNKPGSVTPIPLVRVPRIFLNETQTPGFLKKRFQPLQKGEQGEMKIFKCALGLTSLKLNVGMAIFPNVDSHCFKQLDSHVEIDMVLIHPIKGVFVFNVKNADKVEAKNIASDVQRHSAFLRRLCCQGTSKEVPINTVMCSLKKKMSEKFQKDVKQQIKDESLRDRLFFFEQDDIKDFSENWNQRVMHQVEDLTATDKTMVEILSLRLFGMNVMTGSIFHIHRKLVSNDFQQMRTKKREDSANTLSNYAKIGLDGEETVASTSTLVDGLEKLCKSDKFRDQQTKGPQEKVILWTEQQIKVIGAVMKELMNQKQGCRIVVAGCKGSGKTLIMMQIAFLAENLFDFHSIIIADGRLGSSIVYLDEIRKFFQDSNVYVASTSELQERTKGCQMLMFDECNSPAIGTSELERYASKIANLIIFTSRKMECSDNYKKFFLDNTLRMSVEMAKFAEEFRSLLPEFHELKMQARHNLIGVFPTVDILEFSPDDLSQIEFVTEAVNNIEEALRRSVGLRTILVTPFVHAITLKRILDSLNSRGISYVYRNPKEAVSHHRNFRSNDESSETLVMVGTGNHIDGAEYGTVVVLLEASLPIWWSRFLIGSMFIAITRATISLKVVMNASQQAPLLTSRHAHSKLGSPFVYREKILLETSEITNIIEQCAEDMKDTIGPIFFIGSIPKSFKTVKCPLDYTLPAAEWYTATNGKNVVTIDEPHFHLLMELNLNPSIIIIAPPECETLQNAFDVRFDRQFDRHGFLFCASENPAWSQIPIVWLHPSLKIAHELREGLKKVQNFCFEHGKFGHNVKHAEEQPSFSEDPIAFSMSWRELKQSGNDLFKAKQFIGAVEKYTEAAEKLNQEYDACFENWNLHVMLETRRELAKVYSNLANATLNLQNDENAATSLDYAKTAILKDPTWEKGWYWRDKCWALLGLNNDMEDKKFKKLHKLPFSGDLQHYLKENSIQEKIKRSASWDLIRFKNNSFLIDTDGNGHFSSLTDAFRSMAVRGIMTRHSGPMNYSLLLRPGTYPLSTPDSLAFSNIDIIGDWEEISVERNSSSLLSQDSSISLITTSVYHGSIISLVENEMIRIARITMLQNLSGSGHLISVTNTELELIECSIKNESNVAAVIGASGSKLHVNRCRFIGGYHPLYSVGKHIDNQEQEGQAQLTVKYSVFSGTKIQAVELQSNVSAVIDHCTFHDVGGAGVASGYSDLEVSNSTFSQCALSKSINEGALQLRASNAKVRDTIIEHQRGHGLVIEGGNGDLERLTISYCGQAGILALAPLLITDCKISLVTTGIRVCENAKGDIIMSNNVISDCTTQIEAMGPRSKKPIMKDSKHQFVGQKLDLGRHKWQEMTELRRELLKNPSGHKPQHDFDIGCEGICGKCTIPITDLRSYQSKCGMESYCSAVCRDEDRKLHRQYCRGCH